MDSRAIFIAVAGLVLAACHPRSEQSRFEAALGLPVCETAKIVWHPQIAPESTLIGGHSYGAAVEADRTCLGQLRSDFQRLAGTVCQSGERCVGQIDGRSMAIEDRQRSMMVKVLLP